MKTTKQYNETINIPENVNIKKIDNILYFQGPLGQTALNLKNMDPLGLAGFLIEPLERRIQITTTSKSFFGLLKKSIQNKLYGVSKGFLIYLKIVGIGYRASLVELQQHSDENNQKVQALFLKLGKSHDIFFKLPTSVRVYLIDPTLICLFGVEKNQLTQIAAQIRQLRPPTAYKAKGIRLLNEQIVVKTGKRK